MQNSLKTILKSACLLATCILFFASCQKADTAPSTFNTYFYTMDQLGESFVNLHVDGKDCGGITYAAPVATEPHPGMDMVTLSSGTHNVEYFDKNNTCIASCYIQMRGNDFGTGTWGSGGGTGQMNTVNGNNNVFVGLSNK